MGKPFCFSFLWPFATFACRWMGVTVADIAFISIQSNGPHFQWSVIGSRFVLLLLFIYFFGWFCGRSRQRAVDEFRAVGARAFLFVGFCCRFFAIEFFFIEFFFFLQSGHHELPGEQARRQRPAVPGRSGEARADRPHALLRHRHPLQSHDRLFCEFLLLVFVPQHRPSSNFFGSRAPPLLLFVPHGPPSSLVSRRRRRRRSTVLWVLLLVFVPQHPPQVLEYRPSSNFFGSRAPLCSYSYLTVRRVL